MLKKLPSFLIVFFLLLFFTPRDSFASWTEPTCWDHAYALDSARGWVDEAGTYTPECKPFPNPSTNTTNPSTQNPNEIVNMEGYTKTSMGALMVNMAGFISASCQTNCTSPTYTQNLYEQSAVGSSTKLIASMYGYPPASGIQYIAQSVKDFSLTKKTYAQGIGYSGLGPIQPIWRAFRNLSYVILVIVLVVIGFMIMFRMKLDAQTAISVQNALPNIILTLILITFSYAIAGLMIDLMYFLIMLIISLFSQIGLNETLCGQIFTGIQTCRPNTEVYQEFYTNANTWDLMQSVLNWDTIWALPSSIMGSGIGGLWQRFNEGVIQRDAANWVQGTGLLFGAVAGTIVNGIGGILLTVLISLGLLIIFIRLFFIFLNSYIQIILAVILAPLQLLVGAIPGQNSFRNWFMGLVGNLIVFPTAVALFLLNATISIQAIKESTEDPTGGNLWIPPFLFGDKEGAVDASTPVALIGFGLLMLTPTLIMSVKNLFAPKPFLPITPGTVFSPLVSVGQSGIGLAQQRYYIGQSLQSTPLAKNPFLAGLLGIQKKP